MKKHAVHICVTTAGLDQLSRREQKNEVVVLRKLHEIKRFSVFEATANQVIATTMDYLQNEKLIEVDISPGYPWSNVALTALGRKRVGLDKVVIREGWLEAGRTGTKLAEVVLGQPWTVVLWDDEEDPDCHKSAGLKEAP